MYCSFLDVNICCNFQFLLCRQSGYRRNGYRQNGYWRNEMGVGKVGIAEMVNRRNGE